jgi:hypothetical protein
MAARQLGIGHIRRPARPVPGKPPLGMIRPVSSAVSAVREGVQADDHGWARGHPQTSRLRHTRRDRGDRKPAYVTTNLPPLTDPRQLKR